MDDKADKLKDAGKIDSCHAEKLHVDSWQADKLKGRQLASRKAGK